jgi:hypothetical protein
VLPRVTTGHALLVNIKAGLEQGLFARGDFYTDETLLRAFGAERVRWIQNTATVKCVTLRGL